MTKPASVPTSPIEQIRPTVAKWPGPMSLRVRLMLLVALAVAVVIGIATYLQGRLFERALERDLRETARSTALAVADDFEIRNEPLDPRDLSPALHEFIEAVPSLRAITIVRLRNGQGEVFASTSSDERPEALRVAERAIASQDEVWTEDNPLLPRLAVPAFGEGRPIGAVVVTVSLGSVSQARGRGRIIALAFASIAIITLTVLVDLLARRFIHTPIATIHETMRRAGAGDLDARAAIGQRDEIGAIGEGLNEMLARMQGFNVALQERVREATEELRVRNAELVESYDRMLQLSEALARADQMAAVGHMAANVAHQIGTPLNLISGYVQLTREEAGLDSRIGHRLEIIEEQIARVAEVVRTLLDRARRPSARELVDAAALIERVCAFARPRLDSAGVKIALSIARPVPLLRGDAVQLELALLNVIGNAVDAMPSGGTLTITVAAAEEGVGIEIADTGPGVPVELLPRIFEPWVTTKAPGHGTGLGLSITRDVVVSHGGAITVRNGPAGGAVLRVDLPRATEPAQA